MPAPPRPFTAAPSQKQQAAPSGKPLLWIHTDGLNPESPMLKGKPDSPAVFVWDTEWLTGSAISLKRVIFLAECLREMPLAIELRAGNLGDELLAAAKASGAGYVLAQRTPDPGLNAAADKVGRQMPVVWYDPPAFAESSRVFDLKRFSRYWQKAQHSAMQPTR